MNTRFAQCAAFMLLTSILLAAEAKTYLETQTPSALSDWRESKDGKLAVCFTVDKTTFNTNETIKVRCAVKNCTDKALMILRPFGNVYYTYSAGLTILGPDGAIPYGGPTQEYVLGTAAFVELPAHTVVDEIIELPTVNFPGLGKAGLYTIGYQFRSPHYPKEPAPANCWQGFIKAASLNILVK